MSLLGDSWGFGFFAWFNSVFHQGTLPELSIEYCIILVLRHDITESKWTFMILHYFEPM
uniref:Uncharacterized protein n=1 Tax=Rhizophora mucronata TaxID=61149 RepID=A0A2P2INI0_RHIMU